MKVNVAWKIPSFTIVSIHRAITIRNYVLNLTFFEIVSFRYARKLDSCTCSLCGLPQNCYCAWPYVFSLPKGMNRMSCFLYCIIPFLLVQRYYYLKHCIGGWLWKPALEGPKQRSAAYVGNSLTVHNFYLSFTHRDWKPFLLVGPTWSRAAEFIVRSGSTTRFPKKKIRKDFLSLHNNYTSSTMPARSDRLQIFWKYLGVLSSYKIASKLTSMKWSYRTFCCDMGWHRIVNVSAPLWCMPNAKWLNYKTNNDKLAILGEHCLALG